MTTFEYTEHVFTTNSSALYQAWYNANDHTAAFEFQNHENVATYSMVDPARWERFKRATSQGTAYNNLFRNAVDVKSLGSVDYHDMEFTDALKNTSVEEFPPVTKAYADQQEAPPVSTKNLYHVSYVVNGWTYTKDIEASWDTEAEAAIIESLTNLNLPVELVEITRFFDKEDA